MTTHITKPQHVYYIVYCIVYTLRSCVDKRHMKYVVTLPLNTAPYHGNGKRGLDFQDQLAKRFASLHWNKCPYRSSIKSFSVKRTEGGSGISNMIVKSTGDICEKKGYLINVKHVCYSVTWSSWNLLFRHILFHGKLISDIRRKCILPSMIRAGTTPIIFGKIDFLLISENEFLHEIKCKGTTSFMEFMPTALHGTRAGLNWKF